MVVSFAEASVIPDHYFGEYCVTGFKTYRGGITTDEEAANYVGTKVIIAKDRYVSLGLELNNPVYQYVKSKRVSVEGEIPEKDSFFFGLYPDREYRWEIQVFEPDDLEYPFTRFEIISDGNYFETFDGHVYNIGVTCP